MQFRTYQQNIIEEGTKRLSRLRIIMLAMEVRTGKTLTSLGIANRMDVASVLFITKKKAISSIEQKKAASSSCTTQLRRRVFCALGTPFGVDYCPSFVLSIYVA